MIKEIGPSLKLNAEYIGYPDTHKLNLNYFKMMPLLLIVIYSTWMSGTVEELVAYSNILHREIIKYQTKLFP